MRVLKTKVRPIATGARWAAGDRGARLLGPHGHIAVMYAQSRSMPGGAAHSITCHQDKKGRRYRYYVSAALITEAGTDRAQSSRMVARVLGTRPEWLSKRRRRALSSRPPHSTEDSSIKQCRCFGT